jgi:hypothetical protein
VQLSWVNLVAGKPHREKFSPKKVHIHLPKKERALQAEHVEREDVHYVVEGNTVIIVNREFEELPNGDGNLHIELSHDGPVEAMTLFKLLAKYRGAEFHAPDHPGLYDRVHSGHGDPPAKFKTQRSLFPFH